MKRNSINYWIYVGMMTVFGALIYFALYTGEHIDHSAVNHTANSEIGSFELFRNIISDNLTNSLTILLLQIIVILVTVRIFSFLFKYIGQPGVMVKSWQGSYWVPRYWDIFSRNFQPPYFPRTR